MAKTRESHQLKILYGEGNEDILASQAVSIQRAGHLVKTAVGRKSVMDELQAGTFDLVILGSTLTRDDRHHLPYMIKKMQRKNTSDGTRVLVMHADGARHPQVDANIDSGRSIDELLATISALLAQDAVAQ
jgi:DNA-binding NtrC family response regulator